MRSLVYLLTSNKISFLFFFLFTSKCWIYKAKKAKKYTFCVRTQEEKGFGKVLWSTQSLLLLSSLHINIMPRGWDKVRKGKMGRDKIRGAVTAISNSGGGGRWTTGKGWMEGRETVNLSPTLASLPCSGLCHRYSITPQSLDRLVLQMLPEDAWKCSFCLCRYLPSLAT